MSLLVKICGLSTPQAVEAACVAGADMVGFVFAPKSPRFVDSDVATALSRLVPARVMKVGLFVNADDDQIVANGQNSLAADYFQLHGSDGGSPTLLAESPERIRAIRRTLATPIIKAIGVAAKADLAAANAYAAACDLLLIDAKPPKDAAYPGGHGRPFDWSILSALDPAIPFMLSGGLTPHTVGTAIRMVRGLGVKLVGVDVSSGVESAPGVKDVALIREFVAAVRAVDASS